MKLGCQRASVSRTGLIGSLVAALVESLSASAHAVPTFKFFAQYEESYDEDFNDTDRSLCDPLLVLPTDFHQFGLYMEAIGTGTSPEESFAGALLDINLTGGFTPATSGGFGLYTSEFYSVDPPPPGVPNGPSGPVYSINEDAGEDSTDLKRIVIIAVAPTQFAHAADHGKTGPTKLGTFFLNYDNIVAAISTVNIAENVPGDSLLCYSDTDQVLLGSEGFLAGPTVFNCIPEPASIVLAGLALLGLVGLAHRRS